MLSINRDTVCQLNKRSMVIKCKKTKKENPIGPYCIFSYLFFNRWSSWFILYWIHLLQKGALYTKYHFLYFIFHLFLVMHHWLGCFIPNNLYEMTCMNTHDKTLRALFWLLFSNQKRINISRMLLYNDSPVNIWPSSDRRLKWTKVWLDWLILTSFEIW